MPGGIGVLALESLAMAISGNCNQFVEASRGYKRCCTVHRDGKEMAANPEAGSMTAHKGRFGSSVCARCIQSIAANFVPLFVLGKLVPALVRAPSFSSPVA